MEEIQAEHLGKVAARFDELLEAIADARDDVAAVVIEKVSLNTGTATVTIGEQRANSEFTPPTRNGASDGR